MEDEALERFQQELAEKDKAKAEAEKNKRSRAEFEFWKPHLEDAVHYLTEHKRRVLEVRKALDDTQNRNPGPPK